MILVLIMVLAGDLCSTIVGPLDLVAIVSIFFLEIVVTTFFVYKKKIWWWYLIFPIFSIVSFYSMKEAISSCQVVSDQFITVEGKVNKVVSKDGYNQIYMYLGNDGVIINDKSQRDIIPGDVISARGKVAFYETPRNKGSANLWLYYKTMNIDYSIWVDEIFVVKKNDNYFYRGIFSLKNKLSTSFDNICIGNDAGILKSIILGDKSQLDVNIKELYQVNGIAHILAISGLHVSIIGMGVYKMLRKMCLSFGASFGIGMFLILSYGIMTGNGISTVRAVTMLSMCMFGDVIGRAYDLVSAMCLSAIILILSYPMIIYNSGFLLSFGAVFGISVFNKYMISLFNLKRKSIKTLFFKALISSFCVSLTTLPIILFSYYEVPVFSVFLNLVIVPLAAYLILSGVAGGVIGMFCVPFGAMCAGTAHFVLVLYEKICTLVGKLPCFVLILGKPEVYRIIIFYGFIALFIFTVKVWNKKISLMIVLVAFIFLTIRIDNNDFTMEMIDVGQGDGIYIASKGHSMLIDGGSTSTKQVGKYVIEPFVKSQGVNELDYVVITHGDMDHTNGVIELIESKDVKIRYLLVSNHMLNHENEVILAARKAGIDIGVLEGGTYFKCGNIDFTCLHPDKDYVTDSENDRSVVLFGECEGFKMLFTGDIEDLGENSMIKKNLLEKIDLLKVAHHGSRFSTDEDFLNLTRPKLALISCGKDNSYGHPHKELMERLNTFTNKIYMTKDGGMLTVVMKDSRVRISEFLRNKEFKIFYSS